MPLVNMAGKDATDGFWNYHPEYVWKKLPNYHVANLSKEDRQTSTFVNAHRELGMQFEKEGLFETDYSYYFFTIPRIFCILGVALYFTLCCESFSAHLFGAFIMGCYW